MPLSKLVRQVVTPASLFQDRLSLALKAAGERGGVQARISSGLLSLLAESLHIDQYGRSAEGARSLRNWLLPRLEILPPCIQYYYGRRLENTLPVT